MANLSTLLGLIHTALAECQIAAHINKRPSDAAIPDAPTDAGLIELIPKLLSAVDEEVNFPQDVFHAQVCLGWLHWTLSEPSLAAARLPKDFDVALHVLSGDGQLLSAWTEVCIVKGGYLKGAAFSIFYLSFKLHLTI